MIKLTRIQGEEIYINEDNIQWIECNPDTTITFINGNRFIVRENISQILALMKNNTLSQEMHEEISHPAVLPAISPQDEKRQHNQ